MSANGETDKKSIAARLVGMAQERYLLGVSEDGEPFGADRTRPHLAMLLRGGRAGLRADLAARYFTDTGAVAGGQALTDSTLILEGLAATQPPERVHLRVADHEGTIYIDTGRPDGQVIRIGQGRWAVTNTAPVRFLRTKLTGAMPVPPQMATWRGCGISSMSPPRTGRCFLQCWSLRLFSATSRIRCWRSSLSKAARRVQPHACWSISLIPRPFLSVRRHATPTRG